MSIFDFSKRSRRRFSRGAAKGMRKLWARMCCCFEACAAKKGWERILAKVGRSSALLNSDEISDFASIVSKVIAWDYLVKGNLEDCNFVSLFVL